MTFCTTLLLPRLGDLCGKQGGKTERARDAGVYTGHSRTHRSLQQLWQQAEDGKQARQNLSREGEAGRKSQPLTLDSCREKESQFSLRVCPVVGWPNSRASPIPKSIWETRIGLNRLKERRGAGAGHTSSSGGMVGEGGTGRHGEVVNVLKLKFSKN